MPSTKDWITLWRINGSRMQRLVVGLNTRVIRWKVMARAAQEPRLEDLSPLLALNWVSSGSPKQKISDLWRGTCCAAAVCFRWRASRDLGLCTVACSRVRDTPEPRRRLSKAAGRQMATAGSAGSLYLSWLQADAPLPEHPAPFKRCLRALKSRRYRHEVRCAAV